MIYIHNSVRPGNMFVVYPLDVFLYGETAEAATMIREGMSRDAIRNWLDAHVDQVFGEWKLVEYERSLFALGTVAITLFSCPRLRLA